MQSPNTIRFACFRRKFLRRWGNTKICNRFGINKVVSGSGSLKNTMPLCWLRSGEMSRRLFWSQQLFHRSRGSLKAVTTSAEAPFAAKAEESRAVWCAVCQRALWGGSPGQRSGEECCMLPGRVTEWQVDPSVRTGAHATGEEGGRCF